MKVAETDLTNALGNRGIDCNDTTTTARVDWKYEDVSAIQHPQYLAKTKPIPQPL
jgi:hypothetical protein